MDALSESYRPGEPPATLSISLPGLEQPNWRDGYWDAERLRDIIEEYGAHFADCNNSTHERAQAAAVFIQKVKMAAEAILRDAEIYEAACRRWKHKDDECNAIFDAAREAMDDPAYDLIFEAVSSARDLQRKMEIAVKVSLFDDTSSFGDEARAVIIADISRIAKGEAQ